MSLFYFKRSPYIKNLCLYNVRNYIYAEKVKVAFVTCEKELFPKAEFINAIGATYIPRQL